MAIEKYGRIWPEGISLLDIELICFRDGNLACPSPLLKQQHFKNIAAVCFPSFRWHPWADELLDGACETHYLSVSGSGSSGKSHFAALFLLINWMCSPHDTLGIIVSNTLAGAKKRVWASVEKFWNERPGLPGKLLTSPTPRISFINDDGKKNENAGIIVLPSEKGEAAKSTSIIQGIHSAARIFFLGDELTGCAQSILDVVYSNLRPGAIQEFWFGGLGNADSYFDPHGQICRPKDGWNSISVLSKRWITKWNEEYGICIHFDDLFHPNYLAKRNIYPFLKKWEIIDKEVQGAGANSLQFWKMFRGFWSPVGTANTVFTEADIMKFGALEKVTWKKRPVRIAALDCAFTSGGDRSPAGELCYGETTDDEWVIQFEQFELLKEDVTKVDSPHSYQIVNLFKKFCEDHKINPFNSGYDNTGGGIPFGNIMTKEFSPDVLGISFGGNPSDKLVGLENPISAKDHYGNRVTELYFNAVEFLRSYQLKGLTPDICKELCSRRYGNKNDSHAKIVVESKKDFKERQGFSPDLADMLVIGIAVARERLGAIPGAKGNYSAKRDNQWKTLFNRLNTHSTPETSVEKNSGWAD